MFLVALQIYNTFWLEVIKPLPKEYFSEFQNIIPGADDVLTSQEVHIKKPFLRNASKANLRFLIVCNN